MSSNPKRWVIKPLSPKLEQSDLRSILSPVEKMWGSSQESFSEITTESTASGKSTPDVHVQARLVAVSEDGSNPGDSSTPSSPASTTGSNSGFYSFVDDPTSPEAEMNEVYMVSPKRQAKLNTLKEKKSFILQTYHDGKRPGRLFEEHDEDDHYKIQNGSPVNEEQDRMDIIRKQAPKKSPVLKEQWSAIENLDLRNGQRLIDGFSLMYQPVKGKTDLAKVEPGNIDNEQIDFNAARKQFLVMEQSKQNSFLLSPQYASYSPKIRGQTISSNASIFSPKPGIVHSVEENQTATKQKKELNTSLFSDTENGVFGFTISNKSLTLLDQDETPIQREIRISREREEDLRRSRGILSSDNSEMVKIRAKPIMLNSQSKIKETNRVSLLVQKELVLDKLPQIPISDQKPQTDEIPIKSLKQIQAQNLDVCAEDKWNTEKHQLEEDILSPCCPHRHPEESIIPRNANYNGKLKKESSWTAEKSQKSRIYSPTILSQLDLEKNSMNSPAWKSQREKNKWSPKLQNAADNIRQEIEEDLRREQELQEIRESLSVPSSSLSSVAMSSDLKDEENMSLTPLMATLVVDCVPPESKRDYSITYSSLPQLITTDKSPPLLHSRLPSMSVVTPQPWSSPKTPSSAAPQAHPITPLGAPVDMPSPLVQKGMADTLVKDFEERRIKTKLEESAYAGIQPIDSINNEVVEATRVTRHKNQRALQWEAGMYANLNLIQLHTASTSNSQDV